MFLSKGHDNRIHLFRKYKRAAPKPFLGRFINLPVRLLSDPKHVLAIIHHVSLALIMGSKYQVLVVLSSATKFTKNDDKTGWYLRKYRTAPGRRR